MSNIIPDHSKFCNSWGNSEQKQQNKVNSIITYNCQTPTQNFIDFHILRCLCVSDRALYDNCPVRRCTNPTITKYYSQRKVEITGDCASTAVEHMSCLFRTVPPIMNVIHLED